MGRPRGEKGGHIEWPHWVFADGRRMHMKIIRLAVSRMYGVPRGFYAEAKRLDLPNLSFLAGKARSLGLRERD